MRSELLPPSPPLHPTPTSHNEVVALNTLRNQSELLQPINANTLVVQNIALPNSISIPDIHLLILDAFDNLVAPSITTLNPHHRLIKVFISRTVLSNSIRQILVPLSTHLNQITINDLNNLAIHALMLSGIDI